MYFKNDIILANGVQLGGHVEVNNFAIVGGMTPVHQFCKIGKYAFVGGGLRVVQDVPPFIIANGEPLKFSGINILGLRRRKFNSEDRDKIKKIYKLIYNSEHNISQAINYINENYKDIKYINDIVNFIQSSKKGYNIINAIKGILYQILAFNLFRNNIKNEVFDKYSILDIENQNSHYTFFLSSPLSNPPSFSICWKPT